MAVKTFEQSVPVRTLEHTLQCECGGEMVFDGYIMTANPPIYPHSCQKCGERSHEHKMYPYMGYIREADGKTNGGE